MLRTHPSRSVTQLHALTKDAWGNARLTYRAETRLSRRDYGIRGTAFWNSEFDPGRFAVTDTVRIELEISATIPNTARWNTPRTDSLVAVVEGAGVEKLIADVTAGREGPTPLTDEQLAVSAYKLPQRDRTEASVRLFAWLIERSRPSAIMGMAANIPGEVQLNRGERVDAVRNFRRALSIDPEDPLASTG